MFTTEKISCNFHSDNNIDGLFIINIYAFKLQFTFLVSRMWPAYNS